MESFKVIFLFFATALYRFSLSDEPGSMEGHGRMVLTESDQWRWEDKMFRGWVSVSGSCMSCWSKVDGYVGQDEDCCKNEDKSNLYLYRRPEHNECFKLWTRNLTNTIMNYKDDEQNKNNEKCLSSHSEK